MNCPLCAAPLLFGTTSCPCGYNRATAPSDELSIELSYWEALRAYWRVYWPTQMLLILAVYVLAMFVGLGPLRRSMYSVLVLLIQFAGSAGALYLFVPRLLSRPYRGFSLVAVTVATGLTANRMRAAERGRVWLFLWWRQILAAMIAAVLTMPLNALLSIMGLQLAQWVAVLAGVLGIGPILLKMLIGHEFSAFRIEARRVPKKVDLAPAAVTTGPI